MSSNCSADEKLGVSAEDRLYNGVVVWVYFTCNATLFLGLQRGAMKHDSNANPAVPTKGMRGVGRAALALIRALTIMA